MISLAIAARIKTRNIVFRVFSLFLKDTGKEVTKIFLKFMKIALLTMAFFGGLVPFSHGQHADIWLTLDNNQVAVMEYSEYDTITNQPVDEAELVAIDAATGKFLFPAAFGTFSDPSKTDQPGFQSLTNTFDANNFLYYRAVGSLWFWNGQAWVNEVADQERVKIRDVVYSYSIITDSGVSSPLGAIAQINGNGSLHQHIDFFIENLGSGDPATGAYMIDIEFFGTDTPGGTFETHLTSEPVRIAFNYQMSEAAFAQAINALTSQPEPEAVAVPMPNGALFLLASLLFIFAYYEKTRKSIVR